MKVLANVVVYLALAGSLAVLAVVLFGLRRAIDRSGWRSGDRERAWQKTSRVLIIWYVAALALSALDLFDGTADSIPTIELGTLVPIIAGAIALRQSDTLSDVAYVTPQSWLVGVQLFRTLGVVFLVLFGLRRLPGSFALPAGIGEVLVGLLAPILAIADARGVKNRDRLVRLWNGFGIVALVVTASVSFLSAPSPLQLLSIAAPNELIGAFPLVMIPVFVVPLAVLLHLMSLMKLRQMEVRERRSRTSARVKAL